MTIYLLPMLLAPESHEEALTPYSVEVIKNIKVFFVENIKTTRRFLASLKAGIEIDGLKFIEVGKHSNFEEIFEVLSRLEEDAGIISEAGCAGVADPGALVVEAGHQLGFTIKPLVGPSSILLALMASGFNGQSFAFHGYLPIKDNQRAANLRNLEKESLLKNQTQIFIETPYRNMTMIESVLKTLNPDTRLCIATDLNSSTEYIKSQSISAWKRKPLPDLKKRPAVFLIQA